jgi:DNA-binding response OmpR family regulator
MAKASRPLIVFLQDQELSHSLASALGESYSLQRVSNLESALSLIATAHPLVLVYAKAQTDWSMVKQLSIYSKERQPLGLIKLAASYSFSEEQTAFSSGVDHYLLAASPTQSIVARIVSVAQKVAWLRQKSSVQPVKLPKQGEPIDIDLNGLNLHIETNRVFVNQKHLELPPIQNLLLHSLISQEGKILSRQDLQRLVWKGQKISPRSIDAQISKLKSTFPVLKDLIKNVYGKGYIFERSPLRRSA